METTASVRAFYLSCVRRLLVRASDIIYGVFSKVALFNVGNFAHILHLEQGVHHGRNVCLAEKEMVKDLAEKEENNCDSTNEGYPVD